MGDVFPSVLSGSRVCDVFPVERWRPKKKEQIFEKKKNFEKNFEKDFEKNVEFFLEKNFKKKLEKKIEEN